MTPDTKERNVLRDLARRYADLCRHPDMARRRDIWRRHNSQQTVRPPIYVRAFAWRERPDVTCV